MWQKPRQKSFHTVNFGKCEKLLTLFGDFRVTGYSKAENQYFPASAKKAESTRKTTVQSHAFDLKLTAAF